MGLGTNNPSQLDKQSPNYDYSAGRIPFPQTFAATNRGLGDAAHLATDLKANTAASNGNFQFSQNGMYNHFNPNQGGLNGALGSMYQGQQALQNGPQNAFGKSQLQNMHALGLGQLSSANRAAMQGLAGANASRGVAGNSIGGIMSQQLGVAQAGALAQGDLQAQLQGRQQGLSEYQARSGVASQLGNMVGNQDQRNFMAQDEMFKSGQDEKKNAFDNYTGWQKSYNDLYQQYLIQANSNSGAKGGSKTLKAIQAKMDDAKRNMNVFLQQYNRYGNQKNPNYTMQMADAAQGASQ